jgi:hypothetical protein
MLCGMTIFLPKAEKVIDLKLSGTYDPASNTILMVVGSTLESPTFVRSLHAAFMFYNSEYVNSAVSKYFNIQGGVTTGINYQDSQQTMTNFNTFVGLRSFSMTNQTSLNLLHIFKSTT